MNLNKKTKRNLITYGSLVPVLIILGYLMYIDALSNVAFWGIIIAWGIILTLIQYLLNPEDFKKIWQEAKAAEENTEKVRVAPTWASLACDAIIVLMYIASWVLVIHQGKLGSMLVALLVLTFVLCAFVGLNYFQQKVEVNDGKINWKRLKAEMWRNRAAAFLFALAFIGMTHDEQSWLAKASLIAFILLMFCSGFFIKRIK